jgi:hypothetical protein
MLSKMEGKPRLSKPWKRAWSVVVFIIFIWSLPSTSSDIKPWKHLVRHVSSTVISIVGVVVVVVLLAVINLSELEHAWARLRGGSKTDPQLAPEENATWASTLDSLTPYKNPIVVEPDAVQRGRVVAPHVARYEEAGPKNSTPFPDLTEEWAESDRLMQRCAGSVEVPDEVWAWVNSVFDKLFAWKPTKALEVRPDEPATKTTIPLLTQAFERLGVTEETTNHSRKSLIEYRNRLAKIMEEEGG